LTRVRHADRGSAREDCLVTARAAHARLLATVEGRYLSVAAHIARMSRYTEAIALRLGLDADRARLLRGASRLHDIGKLAIPDRILLAFLAAQSEIRRLRRRAR
jgi:response regulator RpfG family c-di-GMP phosphodiesterase